QQVKPRLVRATGLDQVTGAIGRVVVDDQDLETERKREQPIEQRLDVLALVVGRHDHELLHHAASSSRTGSGRRLLHTPIPSRTSTITRDPSESISPLRTAFE